MRVLHRGAVSLAALCLFGGVAAPVVFYGDEIIAFVGPLGYMGAFLLGLVTNAVVLWPGVFMGVPTQAVLGELAQAKGLLVVALAYAAGGVLGEVSSYMVGRIGYRGVDNVPFARRVEGWMARHSPGRILFLLAVFPTSSLFDVGGILAGAMRYPLWRFWAVSFPGRALKTLYLTWFWLKGIELGSWVFGQSSAVIAGALTVAALAAVAVALAILWRRQLWRGAVRGWLVLRTLLVS